MATDSQHAPRPTHDESPRRAAAQAGCGERLDASGSLAAVIDSSPRAALQRHWRERIQGSAYGTAQRRLIGGLFGPAAVIQRALIAGDLAEGNIPGGHVDRVLAVLNTYDEDTIRANLDMICWGRW